MNAPTRVLVRKEFRAPVPLWSASVVTVCAAGITRQALDSPLPTIFFTLTSIAMLASALGAIALGAQSIGHEYAYRTLPILLSQPRPRRALLGAKLGVLAPMVASLTALAWWFLFRDARGLSGSWHEFPPPVLIAACAVFLAPCLTMLSRSTMAGIVFTFGIPPSLLAAGDVIGVWWYGDGAGARIDEFKFRLLWWGTLSVCALAAVTAWRTFMRLEAVEGVARHLELPELYAGPARRKRSHPILLLVNKELRLQQLTFVLIVIYIAAIVGLRLTQGSDVIISAFYPLTVLYAVLLGVVIGSLALAEERQYGMHDVQRLLPIATWQQWSVKLGMAFALALLGGFGIPILFAVIGGDARVLVGPSRAWLWPILPVVLLTSGSLYTSSLASSGVRAAVMTLPAFVCTLVLVQTFESILRSRTGARLLATIASILPFDRDGLALGLLIEWTPAALVGCLTVLLVAFAYRNDHSGERSSLRVVRQLLAIAALVVVALTLLTAALTARYAR